MNRRIVSAIALTLVALFVASCGCRNAVKVQSIQRKDKLLSCKEITLEINEAEFYRRSAEDARGAHSDSFFAPLCRVQSYRRATSASQNADERLEYLNQIYDLMGCARHKSSRPPAAPIHR